MTVSMVIDAIVFWLLGSAARTGGAYLRPILLVFSVGYLAFTVLATIFFFPVPAIWNVVVVACLMAATVTLKPIRLESAPAGAAAAVGREAAVR
jgi:hypothetical protein